MKLTTSEQVSGDCIVVGIDEAGKISGAANKIDQACGGMISRGVATGDISKKPFDTTLLPLPTDAMHSAVLVIGTGASQAISVSDAFTLGATALRALSGRQRESICVTLTDQQPAAVAEALVAGAVTGTAGQAIYQSEPKRFPPSNVSFLGATTQVLEAGQAIGESVNVTRRLVNEPGNVIYPKSFVDAAVAIAKECELEIEVWDEAKLREERCRAILAVGQGSVRPPRLVKLTYRGDATNGSAPIALVGKGVTFDSGGLSLKPSASMVDMKMDMAGAATVLGVLRCLAHLQVPCNVVGYMGLAENMVDGNSYRLGDVIETRSGKTIEILNTDAEGRVVLADVLDVAAESQPTAIVDLATLTGACLVALGNNTAGLMGNDQPLQAAIQAAAQEQGEYVWPLPMHSFFDEQVRSKVADLKNVGEGRWGGAITAAKFLEAFVRDSRWLHIDIAGPAFAESPTPQRDAGATGTMVRTLVHCLRQQS